MLNGARSVISISLAVAAGLTVLWIIGVATTHPAPAGLAAVGAGIHAVITGFSQIVSGL
jgi:hypothetical protein